MVTIIEEQKQQLVNFTGDFTINAIGEICDVVKKNVSFEKNIQVRVKDISAFDISAIQLLYALKKSADSHQVDIAFDIQLPEDTISLLKNAGFNEIVVTEKLKY